MENDENRQRELELKLWCRIRNFPYEQYEQLDPVNKSTFYKMTCQENSSTTHRQRETLINSLFYPGSNISYARDFNIQVLTTIQKQENFLSPLTQKEKNDYFAKF